MEPTNSHDMSATHTTTITRTTATASCYHHIVYIFQLSSGETVGINYSIFCAYYFFVYPYGGDLTVTTPDVLASNGVIHIIKKCTVRIRTNTVKQLKMMTDERTGMQIDRSIDGTVGSVAAAAASDFFVAGGPCCWSSSAAALPAVPTTPAVSPASSKNLRIPQYDCSILGRRSTREINRDFLEHKIDQFYRKLTMIRRRRRCRRRRRRHAAAVSSSKMLPIRIAMFKWTFDSSSFECPRYYCCCCCRCHRHRRRHTYPLDGSATTNKNVNNRICVLPSSSFPRLSTYFSVWWYLIQMPRIFKFDLTSVATDFEEDSGAQWRSLACRVGLGWVGLGWVGWGWVGSCQYCNG